MVRRKAATAASWIGEKLLSIVVLALLMMAFGIPVVIFTQMGMSETWAYLVMAAFLVGVTGLIVACILWGVKKGDRIRRGID